MQKPHAINKVNTSLEYRRLDNSNTHFATINKGKPVWWLNIPPKKFTKELHILLAKKEDSEFLIWLRIEEQTIANPDKVFNIRDTGAVDLEISSYGNRYMCDVKSGGTGYNFRRHIEQEWG